MRIELICFGTELLKDKTNTNVQEISKYLAVIGLSLTRVTTAVDQNSEVENSLSEALKRSEVVITCGGLGPTFDDLTRECVSKVIGEPLVFSEQILEKIQKKFEAAGLRMPEENKKQAFVIKGAKVLKNQFGTAPGQLIQWNGKTLALLPGPPKELIPMMKEEVCTYLKEKYPKTVSQTLVLHIYGYPESEIDERIKPVVCRNWNQKDMEVIFGILAHHSIIDVKVAVQGKDENLLDQVLSAIKSELVEILEDDIYGADEETMESAVGKLLQDKEETLSSAESCTGGLFTDRITNVSGSSVYFKEGVVAYSNESKTRILGVNADTIKEFGAVSEETAREMATGVLKNSGSDWAVSITGIAGPLGGTEQKPVGTVCFAIVSRKRVFTFTKRIYGTRLEIKERSVLTALDFLRRQLIDLD